MPYNGSGVFTPLFNWQADRDAGIAIRADRMDGQDSDIATGLSTALTKDGQVKPTTNLDWNGFGITNAADPLTAGGMLTLQQSQRRMRPFNLLMNGDFRIWQRVGWTLGGLTTAAATAAGQYTADRWFTRRTTSIAYSLIQVNTAASSNPVRTAVKIIRTAADANVEPITIAQSIDQYDWLAALNWGLNNANGTGNYLQFSAYLYKGANFSGTDVKLEIMYSTSADQNAITGAGWTSAGITTVAAASLTAGIFSRFVINVNMTTIPSTARSVCVRVYYTPTGTAGADDSFTLAGCLLETTMTPWDGLSATAGVMSPYPYEDLGASFNRCQRYFQTSVPMDTAPINGLSPAFHYWGINYQLNTTRWTHVFGIKMRTSPTITFFRTSDGGTAGQPAYFAGGVWNNGSAVTQIGGGSAGFSSDFTTARAADLPNLVSVNWSATGEF